EVWESDGSDAGTRRLADVAHGPASSSPGPFVQAGGLVFFPATTSEFGSELWALPVDARAPCVGDCAARARVTIDDIVTMLDIALGGAAVANCEAGDRDDNGQVTIDEILTAVNTALRGDCT